MDGGKGVSMRAMFRSVAVGLVALVGAIALALGSSLTLGVAAAATKALIMGGTGTPNPNQEAGYIPNITTYYLNNYSNCTTAQQCTGNNLVSVYTPETAWPLYGGLSAPTWKQSILEGYGLYDQAVQPNISGGDDKIVLFGYSQSGAILALEKQKLLGQGLTKAQRDNIEIVVIGNVSRPNGGLNGRLPVTIPIVEFPYGPVMTPTPSAADGIRTTDIAMKWDIIADAPLYVTNPLAMANALIGGPGFGIIHGTYPNPEGDPLPTDPNAAGPGGFTRGEWESIMADPDGSVAGSYVNLHPEVMDIQTVGDTTYYTVTPKILPLVQPLHSLGLKPVADLIEPSLRVVI